MKHLAFAVLLCSLLGLNPSLSLAAVTGPCANCHTMHNSQDDAPLNFDGSAADRYLLRGDCVGCHAQGGGQKIVDLGGSAIPQVYHTDAAGDLAGGNFGYVDGVKGSGSGSSKGHDVIDLFGLNHDGALDRAPGDEHQNVTDLNLTCAGVKGCHGWRASGMTPQQALQGSHHRNVNGALNDATTVANSYRFLYGVKGLENPTAVATEKWQNFNSTSHNEYYGATGPLPGNYADCFNCHYNEWVPPGVFVFVVKPASNTISGFCGGCHGHFHFLQGIGGNITSPFIRHPTDVIINSQGAGSEYAAYTSYDVNIPVGRTTVPAVAGGAVIPEQDTVTCLSCHQAHGSDYPDILRWDYDACDAGTVNAACGCFTCHSSKN